MNLKVLHWIASAPAALQTHQSEGGDILIESDLIVTTRQRCNWWPVECLHRTWPTTVITEGPQPENGWYPGEYTLLFNFILFVSINALSECPTLKAFYLWFHIFIRLFRFSFTVVLTCLSWRIRQEQNRLRKSKESSRSIFRWSPWPLVWIMNGKNKKN